MKTTIEKIGRVSNASVVKGSGRGWDEWVKILTKAGAKSWTHQQIVSFLAFKYKLTPWWQQGVTLGFEIHTGRREEGQTLKGDFTLTVTKSTKVNVKKAWAYMTSADGLALWLRPLSELKMKPGASFESEYGTYGKVRTMKAGVRARLSWQKVEDEKPTIIQLYVAKQQSGATILVISHEGIRSPREKELLRTFWREGLEAVALSLKSKSS